MPEWRAVRYLECPPPPDAASCIERMWMLTGRSGTSHTVIPDGATEIVVARSTIVRSPGSRPPLQRFVVGPTDRAFSVTFEGAIDLIGLRIRPGLARRVLRVPQFRLVDRLVPLDRVAPSLDESLATIVAEIPDRSRCARALAVAVAGVVAPARRGDAAFVMALARARAARGLVSLQTMASVAGVSVRQLERRCQADIGLTPKRWCRILRFQAAVDLANQDRPDWAEVAQMAGYADQPHFCREFRAFWGVAPTRAWWRHL